MKESMRRRETVLVCLPETDQAQNLVRRGAYLAERLRARFVVFHVTRPPARPGPARSLRLRQAQAAMELARELGAEVVVREAAKVSDAIVAFAIEVNATQIILGASTRTWIRELFKGSTTRAVLDGAKDLDVHIEQQVARQ
jgi:two-component system, OmpR family, sensor histidine kinase KdpD